jgi:WD40 repeat protein
MESLPPELLVRVFSFCGNALSFCALARVCKQLHSVEACAEGDAILWCPILDRGVSFVIEAVSSGASYKSLCKDQAVTRQQWLRHGGLPSRWGRLSRFKDPSPIAIHAREVWNLALSQSLGLLFVATDRPEIEVYNLEQGVQVDRMQGHTDCVYGLHMSDLNDHTLYSASKDCTVCEWIITPLAGCNSVSSGSKDQLPCYQLSKCFRGHTDAVTYIAPRGTILYSAGYDHTVRSWDIASGSPLHILQPPSCAVNDYLRLRRGVAETNRFGVPAASHEAEVYDLQVSICRPDM